MRWLPRILRAAVLGVAIGLALVLALRGSSAEMDWRLAAAAVALLVFWLIGRRRLASRVPPKGDQGDDK